MLRICDTKHFTGTKREEFYRYAYDSSIRQCVPFTYGGCFGNDNNFLTKRQCERTCKTRRPGNVVIIVPGKPDVNVNPLPIYPVYPGECLRKNLNMNIVNQLRIYERPQKGRYLSANPGCTILSRNKLFHGGISSKNAGFFWKGCDSRYGTPKMKGNSEQSSE